MAGGRPTKYKEEYCDLVMEVGSEGGWLAEMAEACDVHRSTMDEWAGKHPKFSEALTRAKQKAQAWFEKTGRHGMTADKFNSSLWARQMSSRHPDEYTERNRLEHTGKGGKDLPETDTRQLARAVVALLGCADIDKDKTS